MASQNRNQSTFVSLLDKIQSESYRYEFYQFVRLIECFSREADKQRFGYSSKPNQDAIRLGQQPSLSFAPGEIAKLEGNFKEENDISPAVLKVFFFGLFGPNGPLPLHLTECAIGQDKNNSATTISEFADLFHHRLLSLFYRAWADKEPTVQFDRPGDDRFSFYIGSLLGIAESSQRQRDTISDQTKLHFAAHFGCQTKHASGLIAILNEYFRVPIKIEEFIGEWLGIPTDSLCYLNSDNSNGQLGISATLGRRSWQCMHKFRVLIGPLDLDQFDSFLPNGANLIALHDLVMNYVGFEFDWDINLILKREAVPAVKLADKYFRLGINSWLAEKNRKMDANDLFLSRRKCT